MTCVIDGCTRPIARPAKGWCEAHYTRWRRHGDPLLGGQDRIVNDDTRRFWTKVNKTDTCWLWTAATAHGYGRFFFGGRLTPAHRVAYEMLVGPIPDGLHLDHLCRTPACVNPAHLEPVTQRENTLRGEAPPAIHAAVTHCPSGHPYDQANTYRDRNGWRQCRTCRTQHSRRRRQAA